MVRTQRLWHFLPQVLINCGRTTDSCFIRGRCFGVFWFMQWCTRWNLRNGIFGVQEIEEVFILAKPDRKFRRTLKFSDQYVKLHLSSPDFFIIPVTKQTWLKLYGHIKKCNMISTFGCLCSRQDFRPSNLTNIERLNHGVKSYFSVWCSLPIWHEQMPFSPLAVSLDSLGMRTAIIECIMIPRQGPLSVSSINYNSDMNTKLHPL